LAGHTNPKSTANAFANIRKKLAKLAEENGASAPASPTKATPKKTPARAPATPKSKAGAKRANDDDDDEGEGNMKETAVRNTPKRGGTKRKYVETGSDDDAIKEESDADGEDAGPKTPEPNVGVKVKGKKEGAAEKSPAKSPAKRKAGGTGANKKVKVEAEDDEALIAKDGSKEYTEEQAVKDEVDEGGVDGGDVEEHVE